MHDHQRQYCNLSLRAVIKARPAGHPDAGAASGIQRHRRRFNHRGAGRTTTGPTTAEARVVAQPRSRSTTTLRLHARWSYNGAVYEVHYEPETEDRRQRRQKQTRHESSDERITAPAGCIASNHSILGIQESPTDLKRNTTFWAGLARNFDVPHSRRGAAGHSRGDCGWSLNFTRFVRERAKAKCGTPNTPGWAQGPLRPLLSPLCTKSKTSPASGGTKARTAGQPYVFSAPDSPL